MIFDGLFSKRGIMPNTPMAGPQNSIVMLKPPVAGVQVDEDSALTYSAVWACTRIIAETVAMMPWHVLERVGDTKKAVHDHAVDFALSRRPNDEMTPFTFKETLTAHAVLGGNGYAEIEMSRGGDVVGLWPITPDRVNPDRDSRGRLVYDISQQAASSAVMNPSKIFHLKGLGYDGTVGYSVVKMAKESISLGIATNQYGASFFGNGAIPGGVIEHKDGAKGLSAPAVKNLLKTWNKKNRGAANQHKVEYLDAGMTYRTIGIAPEDAQFLESRKFNITDICRWFRMPPHKLADLERSTHNNIESQNIEFVVDTLMPWVVRMEQEANFKLFRRQESRLYTKLSLLSLLRGDSKSRAEFYKIMLGHGIFDIDEVRALEDRNPLPNKQGKLRMVPLNMASVERAVKEGGTGKGPSQQGGEKQQSHNGRGQVAVAADIAKRLVKLEVKRLQAVCKKPAPNIHGFYSEYSEQLSSALAPLAEVVCDSLGFVGDVSQSITEFTEQWCAQSADDVLQAIDAGNIDQLLDHWAHDRASFLGERALLHLIARFKAC